MGNAYCVRNLKIAWVQHTEQCWWVAVPIQRTLGSEQASLNQLHVPACMYLLQLAMTKSLEIWSIYKLYTCMCYPTLETICAMTHISDSFFGFMTNCLDNRWQEAGG